MYVRTYRCTYRVRVRGGGSSSRRLVDDWSCHAPLPPWRQNGAKTPFWVTGDHGGSSAVPCLPKRLPFWRTGRAGEPYVRFVHHVVEKRPPLFRSGEPYVRFVHYVQWASLYVLSKTYRLVSFFLQISISNHVLIISIFLYTTISKCWAKLHLFVHVPSRLTFNLAWHNCTHFVQLYQ